LTSNLRLLPSNARLISDQATKEVAYHLSYDINDTYNGSQIEENNDSIIIAKTV